MTKEEQQMLVKTWQPHVSKETIEEFLFSQCKQEISDEQKALFIGIAQANNLNPFKREIYPIPFWNTKLGKNDMQPVTAYTVYLQRAQQSGKLNGWNIVIHEDESKKVTGGKITIYRKDWDNPFEREVSWSEIVQTKKDGTVNKNWNDKPAWPRKHWSHKAWGFAFLKIWEACHMSMQRSLKWNQYLAIQWICK